MRYLLLALFALALATDAVDDARAENKSWPPAESVTDLSDSTTWPDDPGYSGMWELFSFIPKTAQSTVRKAELAMGSGIHADRAWQKTIGDDRVIIAVLDSGIKWGEQELVNKFWLNEKELPKPDAACRTSAYDASRPWDANGDKIFNVQDYTTDSGHSQPTNVCDPTLKNHSGGWDTNSNSILDPQDLIQVFSDGKDDDSNGYIDDICGWDFFDNDNDPNDDTSYGHGTGEAKDSTAEGNNGRSDIGVCPLCRVMPVRVGDSFMADANDFATGVVFAVDSGASVVQEALGAISNNSLAISAIDYAYSSNVVVVGSAADENSYHANYPAANDHSLYVHAVVYDGSSSSTSTTFLNFNNCTNYGPRLELSTSGSSCSSEATGKTSGVAGLLYSAALKAGLGFPGGKQTATDRLGARRLSAEEVKQILIQTVDDINIPESKTDTTKYPSRAGWEQRFGYGRTNVRSAVDAILAKKIPPEVDITYPGWFQVLYPEQKSKVTLTVRLSFRKDLFSSCDYVVEYAAGADPEDKKFSILTSKSGLAAPTTVRYDWDISSLTIDNPDMPAPDYSANKRMVTLRVRATAKSTTLGSVKGEARKVIHIQRDADLLPGFPVDLVSSGEASPKTADLDGDGKREIIVATSDGRVHAIRSDGKELSGWPVKVNRLPALDSARSDHHRSSAGYASKQVDPDQYSNIIAAPAIADLDGDKKLEVVIGSYDGHLYVFAADGSVRSGFPVSVPALDNDKVTDKYKIIDDGIFAAPVPEDLDGDKKLEIIVGALDGKVYVWRHDGTSQSGFPVQLQDPQGAAGKKLLGRIVSSPAVGDIDGDGIPDIVLGTNEKLGQFGPLYVVHGQGTKHASGSAIHSGWPRRVISMEVLPMVGEGLPNAPALADINGDKVPEIGIGGVATAALIYRNTGENSIPLCFSREMADKEFKTKGWEKAMVPCTRKILKSCDEEQKADSKMECINGAMENSLFGSLSNTSDRPSVVLITNSSFGDLDNDTMVDFVMPMGGFGAAKAFAMGGKRSDFDHHVGAWTAATGQYLDAFPQRIDDWQFFMNPAVADIDGDDLPEVIVGSAGYWLHAFNHKGAEPSGWPKLTGQWIISSPAVGDLDGDKKLEVVVNSRSGWLYAWRTSGKVDGRIDWESFGHDNRNTRNLATKLEQGISSAELPEKTDDGDEGCSCGLGRVPASPVGALLLALALVLAPWLVSRRRR